LLILAEAARTLWTRSNVVIGARAGQVGRPVTGVMPPGRLADAGEPFMSVASIPGPAAALGGNASGVATTPVVYQYS
jgi:hypothetical protein